MQGTIDVLLGLQWGDEGKGKLVDYLARYYNIIARFQGGPNAGHTLKVSDKNIVLHHLPSGVLNNHIQNVLGSGMVIDPVGLVEEIGSVQELDKSIINRIKISERAVLILPEYQLLDRAAELIKGKKAIGTTQTGIGPTYMQQKERVALRMGDIGRGEFWTKHGNVAKGLQNLLRYYECVYNIELFDEKYTKKDYDKRKRDWRKAVAYIETLGIIVDTGEYLEKELAKGRNVLAEGAQGSMLDNIYGDYPMVTSSNTISGAVCTGLGVPPSSIGKVIGVIKSYTTKVGGGTFPSRMPEHVEILFRQAGMEFGATTGRPRNCGWLDLVQLKYAIRLSGVTELVVLKTDICPFEGVIDMIDSYTDKNGRTYTATVPLYLEDIIDVHPVLFPSWKLLQGARTKAKIPIELKNYLKFIEKELQVPITHIGTGPDRQDIIQLK